MLTFTSSRPRARRALAAGCVVTAGLLVTACGGGPASAGAPRPSTTGSVAGGGHAEMPGMDMAMPSGDGLAAESSGFRLVSGTPALPPGQPASLRFRITDTAGRPVTVFEPDQTKLMHIYLIRSDLSGFQHIHPTMGGDGTWSAPLPALAPGAYRTYASFITSDHAGKAVPLVLSEPLTVPGNVEAASFPSASTTTQVDGYTLTLGSDRLMSAMSHDLEVTVTKGGVPVTDLQPYLDTYAHLTAFRQGDLAFAHLHPHGQVNGDHGGPVLSFEAVLPKPGSWRLFLQFQTGGMLHTATVTVTAS